MLESFNNVISDLESVPTGNALYCPPGSESIKLDLANIFLIREENISLMYQGYNNISGPVLQKSYYDHAIRSDEDIKRIARYIVANPLRAGLASEIGNYPHWDTRYL